MLAHTSPPAYLIRIVDDLLIAQDSLNGELVYTAFKATIAALERAFGPVTSAVEPNTFAGLHIQRRLDNNAINVSMPFHVLNIVRSFFPGIEAGEVSPSKSLPRGVSLPKLLDALWLPPAAERSEKLSPQVTLSRVSPCFSVRSFATPRACTCWPLPPLCSAQAAATDSTTFSWLRCRWPVSRRAGRAPGLGRGRGVARQVGVARIGRERHALTFFQFETVDCSSILCSTVRVSAGLKIQRKINSARLGRSPFTVPSA